MSFAKATITLQLAQNDILEGSMNEAKQQAAQLQKQAERLQSDIETLATENARLRQVASLPKDAGKLTKRSYCYMVQR